MRLFLILPGFFVFSITVPLSATVPKNETTVNGTSKQNTYCPDPRRASPFLRAHHFGRADSLYTTDPNEHEWFVSKLGYTNMGFTGHIFNYKEGPYTYPLYRLWNPRLTDHFYTTDDYEAKTYQREYGYINDTRSIAGYVYKQERCNSVPLYRAYRVASAHHLYTTDYSEWTRAIRHQGYHYEGIVAYVHW
ncbi:hypothetical protein HGRIS_011519 [Hohenbuehelia grisea]|uniref:DUF5648 domain-containing protein n=1 Tax=Hohenbuehelia grisea TaxID=104357 RepID=A0ABR3JX32_9AGAR